MRRPNHAGRSLAEPVPAALIERCKNGDEQAWKELVEATHRQVYTLCLRILRDADDAAEATQESYVKVWRSLRSFRGDAAFETWLYRVASNTALSRHRGRKRRRAHESYVEDDHLARAPSHHDVEGAAGARIDVAELEKHLAELPDHYRSAVVLRDVYEMTIQEIAQRLDISQTAAKVRVHRGRKMLRDAMFEGSEPR